MTTFTTFSPSRITTPPFQFQAVLDGQVYNVSVSWNLFGRRWYVTVLAPDGTRVATRALVGSPTGFTIQSLVWSLGKVTATVTVPHGFKVGRVVELTITGASPDAYNGIVRGLITGPATFTYPIASDPGAAAVFGTVSRNIDLVGGYFLTSTMVYRQAANQFEVSP